MHFPMQWLKEKGLWFSSIIGGKLPGYTVASINLAPHSIVNAFADLIIYLHIGHLPFIKPYDLTISAFPLY